VEPCLFHCRSLFDAPQGGANTAADADGLGGGAHKANDSSRHNVAAALPSLQSRQRFGDDRA
jgi:hypothetical protein